MRRGLLVLLVMLCSCAIMAQDSIAVMQEAALADTLKKEKKHNLGWYITHPIKVFINEFTETDSTYIEPQLYNWAAMAQSTMTYERYRVSSSSGQSVTFAPHTAFKIGPYFGWRWIFAGYTVDVNHLSGYTAEGTKNEWQLSFYTSMLNFDLFWRQTGDNYYIKSIDLGKGIDTSPLVRRDFAGLNTKVQGLSVTYVFNHHRFSYPAAFQQSTRQIRSAGSALLGASYTTHELSLDYHSLSKAVEEAGIFEAEIDTAFMFDKVKYMDISLSGGYAYNWVFAKNWLLCSSLTSAIAYKKSDGDLVDNTEPGANGFSFHNFDLDFTLRMGLVWNTSRWFAGSSLVMHMYNYNKTQFSAQNVFGQWNVYAGINFGKRKQYRGTKRKVKGK